VLFSGVVELISKPSDALVKLTRFRGYSTPIKMAMPASDMMLEVTPMAHMGINARSTDTGIETIGMMAGGMCKRKIRMTTLTTRIGTIRARS